jgi:hypothetical protein
VLDSPGCPSDCRCLTGLLEKGVCECVLGRPQHDGRESVQGGDHRSAHGVLGGIPHAVVCPSAAESGEHKHAVVCFARHIPLSMSLNRDVAMWGKSRCQVEPADVNEWPVLASCRINRSEGLDPASCDNAAQ